MPPYEKDDFLLPANLFLIVLWLCIPGFSNAQLADEDRIMQMPDGEAKVDSILNITQRNRYNAGNEILFEEAFRIVDTISYLSAKPCLLNSYGVLKRDLSQYDKSIELHMRALALSKELDNIHEEIKAYNNLGVAYRRVDDFTTAMENSIMGLKLAEKEGDDYNRIIALNNVGSIHMALNNYRAAIYYFQQCIPVNLHLKNERGITINLQNMGECYEKMGNTDSANYYYKRALRYNIRRDDAKGIGICYNRLGNLLLKKGKTDKALMLYEKALSINQSLRDRIFIADSYHNIARVYFLQKKFSMAEQMFDSSLQIATSIGSLAETKNAYQGLTENAEAQQHWKDAFMFGSLYKKFSDSIENIKNAQFLRRKEITYQQNKIAVLESNERNSRVIIVGGAILFILLLVSSVLYYLRNRLLVRNRSLQRELEIRSQIASDLHDDMGSTLSSIYIFSELLKKGGSNLHELIAKIEANVKDTLEALDDIIWLVKPGNDRFCNLNMHICEFSAPLFESKNIKFDIYFPESIAEMFLPMETRRNVFLIIKESVNNLIKYSECSEASIRGVYSGEDFIVVIKDDGKGFDAEKATNRNGIRNLRNRADQINAEIQIKTAPGEGTEIQLKIRSKKWEPRTIADRVSSFFGCKWVGPAN